MIFAHRPNMLKTTLLGAIALAAATQIGCKSQGPSTVSTASNKSIEMPKPIWKDVIVDRERAAKDPDVTIRSMQVKGDTLIVEVQYGGGCQPHTFDLYTNGGWLKSLPPKATVWLEHTTPEPDPCRALISETLKFNIKPLRYAGQPRVTVLFRGSDLTATYIYSQQR